MRRRHVTILLALVSVVASCGCQRGAAPVGAKEELQSVLSSRLPDWDVRVTDFCEIRLHRQSGDYSKYSLHICDSCLQVGSSNDTTYFTAKPNCHSPFGPISRSYFPELEEAQHAGMGNGVTTRETRFIIDCIRKAAADSLVSLVGELRSQLSLKTGAQ